MAQTLQQVQQQIYYVNRRIDTLQRAICCAAGEDLTFVSTADSASVTFSGNGTPGDPLTAEVNMGDLTTLYTGDGTITDSERIVTVSDTLTFNSPVQGTFEVKQDNADPNYRTLLTIRNGGGNSGFTASVNNDAQFLKLGQFGSRLQGAAGYIDFAGPGVTTFSSDTGGNSRVIVDPTGAATGINYARLNATGSVSGIGTSGIVNITPQLFSLYKTVGGGDTNLFTISLAAGVITASNLAGTGDRMVIASSTGVLSTQAIPTSIAAANPTGTVGLTAVNGVATTFMRSDATPALSQAIAPTWTQPHHWTTNTGLGGEFIRSAHNNSNIGFYDNTNTTRSGYLQVRNTDATFTTSLAIPLSLGTNGTNRMTIDGTTGNITFTGDLNPAGSVISRALSSAINASALASPTNTGVYIMAAPNYADINLYDASQAVNARSFDIINFQNKIQFRLKNDAGSSVVLPLTFNGGFAGYTGITSNTGAGTWTFNGTSSYASPSIVVDMPDKPMIVFHASGGLANRKRWFISGENGNFLQHGITDDAGGNPIIGYSMFRGVNVIGGHNWFIGDGTITNPVMQLANTGVTINMSGMATATASAALEVQSTTQGFLPPKVTTTERDAIASPVAGLMVYNTTTNKLNFYNGTAWEAVTSA